ncbi:heme/hemin ABC transporter substrate-binding protein [Photobacterium phosphoreum]|uniref:heme/hemin ABC transporter substrate-binding protein n=1 Tax=Photobacterium phosphoreum TaxID=659 RepID=UPI00242DF152|nr:ABC transporter substrate-binding protein [Photobacterium phosphoreum]
MNRHTSFITSSLITPPFWRHVCRKTLFSATLFITASSLFSPIAHAQSTPNSTGIISAGAAITEIINALGAKQQLIAVDVTSKTLVANDVPKVGYHRQLSAESLIALAPTRIIGSDEMGPPKTLALLKQSGIEVDIVNGGETVNDLLHRIDQVAALTQHQQQQAQQLKQQITTTVENIKQRNLHQKQPKKVLFLMIHDGRPISVAGKNTTADSIITLAGAINPAASMVTNYKPISTEAILQMQPDIILLSDRTTASIKDMAQLVKKMPMLAATPAAKNNAIAVIDGTALIGGLGIHSINEAMRLNRVFYPQS